MRWSMSRCIPTCRSPCRISYLLCSAVSALIYGFATRNVLTVVLDSIYEDHMVVYWFASLAFVVLISSAGIAQIRLPMSTPGVLLPDVEAADSENWKEVSQCSVCGVTRPVGTHHCRICNVCVLWREHHCPWINNCVGANNQWLFISFIVFILLTSLEGLFFCLFHMIYYSCRKCTRPELWWPVVYTILLAVFMAFSAAGLLTQQVMHIGMRAEEILKRMEEERGPVDNHAEKMIRDIGAWSATINKAFGKQGGVAKYLIINPLWSHR